MDDVSRHDRHGLFAGLDARLEAFARHVVTHIRAETHGYASTDVDEHVNDVFVQVRAALDGLRAGREPGDLDVAIATAVGHRRAETGVPLTAVIDAYLISYREMWSELMRAAHDHGPEVVGALAEDAADLWRWSHTMTAAVADAHASRTQALATAHASLRRHLLDILRDPQPQHDAAETAGRLGLDPRGLFTVAAVAEVDESQLTTLARRVESVTGSAAIGCHDGRLGHLVANSTDAVLEDEIRAFDPAAVAGVGIPRSGIAEAGLSLSDATDALDRARATGGIVRFSEDWLQCSLHSLSQRLLPVLVPLAQAASDHPDWARTVGAFADHGFSASAASRAIHVHANSVRYRMDRWHDATGWDPHTFMGLLTSVIAIQVAQDQSSAAP